MVDAEAFAAAGGVAPPNTVWAVGPGAADAIRDTDVEPAAAVVSYADELDSRRDAPLPSALVTLALVSSAVLLAFAILGAVLAAVAGAPNRAEALGRLRALGVPSRDVRSLLLGELAVPVAVTAIVGAAIGAAGARVVLGSLSLQLVTGHRAIRRPSSPGGASSACPCSSSATLVVAALELRRVRRQSLSQLLRSSAQPVTPNRSTRIASGLRPDSIRRVSANPANREDPQTYASSAPARSGAISAWVGEPAGRSLVGCRVYAMAAPARASSSA